MGPPSHKRSLSEALNSPVWDVEFWEHMQGAEDQAKRSLMALWEESMEGSACSCDTCVVRAVLETIWPTMTTLMERLQNNPPES